MDLIGLGWPRGAVFQGLAYIIGMLVGVLALQLLLKILPLSSDERRWHSRDAALAVIFIFLLIPLDAVDFMGELLAMLSFMVLAPLLFFVPLVFPLVALILFFITAGKCIQPDGKRGPKLATSERLGMVVSVGFAPVVMYVFFGQHKESDFLFLYSTAAVFFLLGFYRAHQRLEANRIPAGTARTGFLTLYPYMVFATLYFFSHFYAWLHPDSAGPRSAAPPRLDWRLILAALISAIGTALLFRVRHESREKIPELPV